MQFAERGEVSHVVVQYGHAAGIRVPKYGITHLASR